jgi:hypothetical protein
MLTLSTVAGSRTSKPSPELTISDLTGKQGWIVIRSPNYAGAVAYARNDRLRSRLESLVGALGRPLRHVPVGCVLCDWTTPWQQPVGSRSVPR